MIMISDVRRGQSMENIKEEMEQKVNIVQTVNVESKPIEITNDTLPEIRPGDKKVLLCVKDTYKLYMMAVINATTMIIEGCKFYLEYEGKLMIGAENELSISKDMIFRATDHSILRILNRYAINFTEDDLKRAFERAKRFVEKLTEMTSYSSSLNIQEAYTEVIDYAKDKAKQDRISGLKECKCKYDSVNKIVSIRDNFLQTILDGIGSGYTKVVFCKKLAMLAQHYEKEFIICNKGRYTFNETGNVRWYKFRVPDEYMDDNGGVA